MHYYNVTETEPTAEDETTVEEDDMEEEGGDTENWFDTLEDEQPGKGYARQYHNVM